MAEEMSNIVRSAQRIKETGGGRDPPPMARGDNYGHRSHFTPQPPPPPQGYDNRSRSAYNQVNPRQGEYADSYDPYGPAPRAPQPRSNYNLY